MADWDESVEDDGYFSEVDDGDDTGKSPKFFAEPGLNLSPSQIQEMKVDDLFKTYIGLRDQLATDRKGYKTHEERMKSQMLTIGGILLMRCDQLGVESLSASTGTGYKSKKERIRVATGGWDELTAWVRETGNFQVLQKRVSPDAVREIREDTGNLPPGVESTPDISFVVRSPTTRKR